MSLRETNLEKLREQEFDVLVIGGGINGAVSAASLAARGVKVALIDKGDFSSGVSSNSSNLAWGGIKYLESHEYLLVNKLCKSRNILMKHYPSTVKEVRKGRTRTDIRPLEGDERVREVADMIAGGSAHETARAEARRLLAESAV